MTRAEKIVAALAAEQPLHTLPAEITRLIDAIDAADAAHGRGEAGAASDAETADGIGGSHGH